MKIKDCIYNISKLGDEDMIIGDIRYHNGVVHLDLILATDDMNHVMYDATPVKGN